MGGPRADRPRLWVWIAWAATFYLVWTIIVLAGGHWAQVVKHWPIAVAMTAGSYVAGSTPMGGGTIGFPILVLLFDRPPDIGRHFSFAVQAIGMTSAAIFIVARRQAVDWRFLRWTCLASALATPLSLVLLAPRVPGLYVKVLFACVWASFGVMHLARIRDVVGMKGDGAGRDAVALGAAVCAGAAGGVIASITGVGVEMLVYAALVVLFRVDVRIAIPTAVMAAAFTSIIGIVVSLAQGVVREEVLFNWLAATPIVVLGAPLGAKVVQIVSRKPTLLIVSALCVGQFAWTMVNERLSARGLALSLCAVGLFLLLFRLMYAWGERRRAVHAA